MTLDDFPPTSRTLLIGLAGPRETAKWNEAWARFVALYLQPTLKLCRQCGVRKDDMGDVSQEVLLKLMSSMATFECRRWLKVVVQRAIEDLFGDLERAAAGSDEARLWQVLHTIGAGFKATPAEIRARQLLRKPTPSERAQLPEEHDLFAQFEAQWWEAGAAIWQESRPSFDDFFGRLVKRSGRRWGLEDDLARQAERLLQERIVHVHETLQEDSLPRFRSWLKEVVRNAARDCLKKLRKMAQTGDTRIVVSPDSIAVVRDFVHDLVERDLLNEAEQRVRCDVSERDWKIYRAMAHDELEGPEVARDFELTVANVYVIVSRVRKKLNKEIGRLQEPNPSDHHGKEP